MFHDKGHQEKKDERNDERIKGFHKKLLKQSAHFLHGYAEVIRIKESEKKEQG